MYVFVVYKFYFTNYPKKFQKAAVDLTMVKQ